MIRFESHLCCGTPPTIRSEQQNNLHEGVDYASEEQEGVKLFVGRQLVLILSVGLIASHLELGSGDGESEYFLSSRHHHTLPQE